MSDVVTLAIENANSGLRYDGWTTVQITRGMEQAANSFSLSVTERWPWQETARPIQPGESCTVRIDDDVVIRGYVDDVNPSYDATQHTVAVSGRDTTGDLVDCSAIHKSGEWHNRTLLQIAKDLCAPFGISVSAEVPVKELFKRFSIQEGETVFEALERAARLRGVLLVADGRGGVQITRAGSTKISTPLVEGENVKVANASRSWKDRYSSYVVKGQAAGDDDSTPEQNTGPKGTALDKEITRYRPLIVIGEEQGNVSSLRERALWEAAVRRGRGSRATLTVQGWRHAGGLWQPNRLVAVKSPMLGLDREMLIAQVVYRLDEGGRQCDLEVCLPEAFKLQPITEKDKGAAPW